MRKFDNDFLIKHLWQRLAFGISGIDWDIYAIIYNFTYKMEDSRFNAGYNYFVDFLGVSKATVVRSIQKLIDLKLILVDDVLVQDIVFSKPRSYYVNRERIPKMYLDLPNT